MPSNRRELKFPRHTSGYRDKVLVWQVTKREISPEFTQLVAEQHQQLRSFVRTLGVAVLTRVSGLQGEHTADWVTGKTIPPGTLEWDGGLLQLEFYCGATVVAEGPASLEILDDSRVVCRSGRLRVHVPPPARGFCVLAPTVELVVLGTEFGIDVAADGATEVHVFDGAVELYDPKSSRNVTTRRELSAGDAVTLDRNGEVKNIEIRDFDFVTPTRLSTMTDVCRQKQLRQWRAFRDSLQDDPRVVAYFLWRHEAVLHAYRTDSIFNLFRLGQRVHLATVCNADQRCVTHYVNGEPVASEPLEEAASGSLKIGKATIGNWSVPTARHRGSRVRNLNGCMDELIVFGQALDDQEVRRIYEVGRP